MCGSKVKLTGLWDHIFILKISSNIYKYLIIKLIIIMY